MQRLKLLLLVLYANLSTTKNLNQINATVELVCVKIVLHTSAMNGIMS
jgi:hypothetical protein